MGIKLKVNTNLNNNTSFLHINRLVLLIVNRKEIIRKGVFFSDSRLKLLCKLYSSLFIGSKLLKTFLSYLQIFQLYVVVVKL